MLYPLDASCSLREVYRQEYRDIYDYALSENEIDAALHLQQNRQSAGYERFERASGETAHCMTARADGSSR